MLRRIPIILGVLLIATSSSVVLREHPARADGGTISQSVPDRVGDVSDARGDIGSFTVKSLGETIDVGILTHGDPVEPFCTASTNCSLAAQAQVDTNGDGKADYTVAIGPNLGGGRIVSAAGVTTCMETSSSDSPIITTYDQSAGEYDADFQSSCVGDPQQLSVRTSTTLHSGSSPNVVDEAPDSGFCCTIHSPYFDDSVGDASDPRGDIKRIGANFGSFAGDWLYLYADVVSGDPGTDGRKVESVTWMLDFGTPDSPYEAVVPYNDLAAANSTSYVHDANGNVTCQSGQGSATAPRLDWDTAPIGNQFNVAIDPACLPPSFTSVKIQAELGFEQDSNSPTELLGDVAPNTGYCCQLSPSIDSVPSAGPTPSPTSTTAASYFPDDATDARTGHAGFWRPANALGDAE